MKVYITWDVEKLEDCKEVVNQAKSLGSKLGTMDIEVSISKTASKVTPSK